MYQEDSAVDIGEIIKNAKGVVIKNDRLIYFPLLKEIAAFCARRARAGANLAIGGHAAAMALAGETALPSTPVFTAWILEIFTDSAQEIAEDIAARLYDFIPSLEDPLFNQANILVQSVEAGVEYDVWYATRKLAHVRSLGEYRERNVMSLIKTRDVEGPFGCGVVPLVSPEIQAMFCLRALCDPTAAGDWGAIYLPLLDTLMGSIRSRKRGAADDRDGDRGGDRNIQSQPEREYCPENNFVLIGENAANFYIGKKVDQDARLQFIASYGGLNDYAASEKMSATYSNVKIPDDFRLIKTSLRDIGDNSFYADIFNFCDYCPVPYVEAPAALAKKFGAKMIASPMIVLRFLFVDIWSLRFIMADGSNAGLRRRETKLEATAFELFDWMRGRESAEIFPPRYFGTYFSERAAKNMRKAKNKGPRGATMSSPAKKAELAELLTETKEKIMSAV